MTRTEPISYVEATVRALEEDNAELLAEIKRLRAALKNIRELNFTSDGWAHSDLIEQEIVFALTQTAAPGGE